MQLEQPPTSIISPEFPIHVSENFTTIVFARDAYGNALMSGTITVNLLRARCCGFNSSLIFVQPALGTIAEATIGGDGYALAMVTVDQTCDELYCQQLPATGYVMEFVLGATRMRTGLFEVGARQVPVDFDLEIVGPHPHTDSLPHSHPAPVHVAGALMVPPPRIMLIDDRGNRGVQQLGDDVWLWQVDYYGQGCLPCRVSPPCGLEEQRWLNLTNSTCTGLQQNVGGSLTISIRAPTIVNDNLRFIISVTNWDVKGMLRRTSMATDRMVVVPANVSEVRIIDESDLDVVVAGSFFTLRAVLMDVYGNPVQQGTIVAESENGIQRQPRPFPYPFCVGCLTTVDVANPADASTSVYTDATGRAYQGVAFMRFNMTQKSIDRNMIIRLTYASPNCRGAAIPSPPPPEGEPQQLYKCLQFFTRSRNFAIINAELSRLQVLNMPAQVAAGQSMVLSVGLRDAYGNEVNNGTSNMMFSFEVWDPEALCQGMPCPNNAFADFFNGTRTALGLTYKYSRYTGCFPCMCDESAPLQAVRECQSCGPALDGTMTSTVCVQTVMQEEGGAAVTFTAPLLKSLPEGVPLILRAIDLSPGGITVHQPLIPLRVTASAPARFEIVNSTLDFAILGEVLLTQPRVRVTDMYGNALSSGVSVTIGIGECSGRICTVGRTAVTDAAGIAAFRNLTVVDSFPELEGVGVYTLTFSVDGDVKQQSSLPIRLFRFGGLHIAVQPPTSLVDSDLKVSPVVVLCGGPPPCDSTRTIPAYSRQVHVRLVRFSTESMQDEPSGVMLQNNSPNLEGVSITNGAAVFENLRVTQSVGRLGLRFFFATGAPQSSVLSEVFSVTTLQTVRVNVTSPAVVVAGTAFSARTSLLDLRDVLNRGAVTDITMSIDPSCAACRNVSNLTLEGVRTARTVDGTALFQLTIKRAVRNAVLRASSSGGVLAFDLVSLPSTTFRITIVHAAYKELRIVRQPGDGSSGEPLSTQPVLELYDEYGNLCISSQVFVRALIQDVDFGVDDGATIAYGNFIRVVDGVAAFTNLSATVCGTTANFKVECQCSKLEQSECAEQRTLSMTLCKDAKCEEREPPIFTEPINIRQFAAVEQPSVDWDVPQYGVTRVYAADPATVTVRLVDEYPPGRLVPSSTMTAILSLMGCSARITDTSVRIETAVRGEINFRVELSNSGCYVRNSSTFNKTACQGCTFNVTTLQGVALTTMTIPFTVPEGPIYGTEVNLQPTTAMSRGPMAAGAGVLLRDSEGSPGAASTVYVELVAGLFLGVRTQGNLTNMRQFSGVNLRVSTQDGLAVFTDLVVTAPGQGYVLRFTRCPLSAEFISTGVCRDTSVSTVPRQWYGVHSTVDSRPFNVTNTAPAFLTAFGGESWKTPSIVLAGVAFKAAVRVLDTLNFPYASQAYAVSAVLTDASGVRHTEASLHGTIVVPVITNFLRSDAGVAYFTDLSITVPGEGWTLSFILLDPHGVPTNVTAFTVQGVSSTHGPASQLVVVQQPSLSLQQSPVFAANYTSVSVAILDDLGNRVTCRGGSAASTTFVRTRLDECTLNGSPGFFISVNVSGGCFGQRPPGVSDCGEAPPAPAGSVTVQGTLSVLEDQGLASFDNLTIPGGVHAVQFLFTARGVNANENRKVSGC